MGKEIIEVGRIVGQAISSEIYILEHVFRDEDRMGSIGSIYRPVLTEEYEDATSSEGLQRHLTRWWNDAKRRGDPRSIGEFASDLYAEKGNMAIWDLCTGHYLSMLRSYTGLTEEDAPLFTCCGGGMVFNRRIGWGRVSDIREMYHLLDLDQGRTEAWEYFVKCGRG